MSDWLTQALLTYGPLVLGLSAFLSCLFLPFPTSWVMLAGGALAATDTMSLPWVMLAAFTGAVLGDQAGYFSGVAVHDRLVALASRRKRSDMLYQRARGLVESRGWLGVFLSRWLLAPLGPYVNLISGVGLIHRFDDHSAEMSWARFTLWAAIGKGVWVAIYCGLGFGFAQNLPLVAQSLGRLSWALSGLVLAGVALIIYRQKRRTPQD